MQVTVAGVGGNFFSDAIPSRDVFNWNVVVGALDRWQQSTVAAVYASLVSAVRADLLERPNRVEEVTDADSYYAAMTEAAAAWIADGRQPILLVEDPSTPRWIGNWLDGDLPTGAALMHRSDIDATNYLGTINGIDIYVGVTPNRTSLLTVSDILESISYRLNSDGHVLQLSDDAAANTMTFGYALGITWTDDPVVLLRYPPSEGNNPYGGG